LDLSLLLLVFSVILTVSSRLLHLYSTDDKTSRLKMKKSFSTVRDTQRGSQSYMEKRRRRREIEVTRRRRGGIKRGDSKLASNHFPMCSPQSGPLRDVHGVIQRTLIDRSSSNTSIVYVYHSLLIHSSADGHLGCYYKQRCDEDWATSISFNSGFLCVYAQQWDCWVIWQFYFQFFKESPHCSP